MPRPPERILSLDPTDLSPLQRLVWTAFLRFALDTLGIQATVNVASEAMPETSERFAFLTSSTTLSRKILREFRRIHLQPRGLPVEIDAHLFRALASAPEFFQVLEREPRALHGEATVAELARFRAALRPTNRRVSLITSVFHGDQFLDGFLANCANLDGYDRCEHFLIRAGSPGREQERIVRHMREHPSAIYLHLPTDPGLYEVWNLGTRLSTAPYLSNANLDDRRSPTHLTRLCKVLDANPSVDVVSSALRVTGKENLAWEESSDCAVWFGSESDDVYKVDALFKKTPEGIRSKNLPHCMPVWRRQLHALHGCFDESQYGPSADWEFWLRVGEGGVEFCLVGEPLGLYLKHEESYWRRGQGGERSDEKILSQYAYLVGGTRPERRAGKPAALQMRDALGLLEGFACMEGLAELLRSLDALHADGHGSSKALASKIGRKYLACNDFKATERPKAWGQDALGTLFLALVEVAHHIDPGGASTEVARRVLTLGCVDLHEATRDRRWLCLRAFILRKFGEPRAESNQLRALHTEDRKGFWTEVQSVYRFTVALDDLAAMVHDIRVPRPKAEDAAQPWNLVFYPHFASNRYQELLYRSVIDAGGTVTGAKDIEDLAGSEPVVGARNVFHIHWINRVFLQATANDFETRASHFLPIVKTMKEKGFSLYWTVHNRTVHESVHESKEISFRRALYDLADRVYLHHPMVADLLGWLPGRDKLCLMEHGSYGTKVLTAEERKAARSSLGLSPNDFVLAHIGQIRDYKALHEVLPPVLDVLAANPRMKLLVAGSVTSDPLRQMLRKRRHERMIVIDEFLPLQRLERCMQAADLGLLSYRSIITSGSLFHWCSAGTPVLAPALGTIPAYVVDGWNGFTYRTPEELGERLKRCVRASSRDMAKLGANARTMADSLRWEFF